VKYSENVSRGFPGNRLTGPVILERGNTVCSSMTSHTYTVRNVVGQWIAVAAKILVIPSCFVNFHYFYGSHYITAYK